jgi:hypothetical protein
MAGVLTLLIALAAILASYAVAAGWVQPRIANVTDDSGIPGLVVGGTSRARPTQPAATESTDAAPADTSRSPLGIEDGYVPDDVALSPWDTDHPAIANLDPDLLDAIQRAATDADADGIMVVVSSGWRSERYQRSLLTDAVATYGSEEEARKWVNAPDASTHVTGDGVDLGDTDADYWLIEHGNAYGLCQTYENEIWHFELAVAPGESCLPPLPDATGSVPEDLSGGVGTVEPEGYLSSTRFANWEMA